MFDLAECACGLPYRLIRVNIPKLIALRSSSHVLLVSASQTAQAEEATKVPKAMSDYMVAQKSISATFDSDIEVVARATSGMLF
jgi:hypothetical protein